MQIKNIESIYEGDLRVRLHHLKSGTKILTDAPIDNQGKGGAFSPTDLLAASLASCILTIAGIHFRQKNIELTEIKCDVRKIMASNPRKIAEVQLEFDFGINNFGRKELLIFQSIIETCPVTLSLNPSVKINSNLDLLLGQVDK